jgi:hypothetical protein
MWMRINSRLYKSKQGTEMKAKFISIYVLILFTFVTFYSCSDKTDTVTDALLKNSQTINKRASVSATVTVFATGLNNPRELKFGPDGYLYVAEAGLGGNISTQGQCDQVIPPVGPYLGGNSARISKINSSGVVSTVVDDLPSAEDALGDRLGVADIEFMNNNMYALVAAGGCSHGHSDYPASIIKINSDGTWSVFADLSDWQMNHPVANPEPDDFEPDGTWYSFMAINGYLYAVEPNHCEMVRVSRTGNISRVIDFSAVYGHIVPTVLAYHGNFYVGNLNTFPIVPGSSNIYKVTPSGQSKVWASGFSAILGLVFDNQANMYVLETASVDGFPTPNTGRIVKVLPSGTKQVLVDTLNFPTGMTLGSDGAVYVSNNGFGTPDPGVGEILKVTLN